ncbi:DJ-1/PfpI family protein [Paenibacillus aestuarii]|uniref:DJ-1/PfpI family protein n=1 Tax=Paenibacillus aestuarii TaxID=516965 RepID=A0ABW0K2F9_9BACL|nr:DJ-1/PfpI family protein [Paenibacillus aestuarii]
MLDIQIVLFDGFDLLDVIAPYEVFCAAGMMTDGAVRVEFVTAEGPRLVPSGVNGVPLEAVSRLRPDRKGIILVPGASGEVEGDGSDSIPAVLGRTMNTGLTGMIEQALAHPDMILATVCGGSLVLAMGGLLEGRPAVTHPLGMDMLEATGATPVKARVVDDGNLVTGGGVTSGLDVALHLVERELGPRIAHEVERLFDYERRGTVWRNSGLAPHTSRGSAVSDASPAQLRPDTAAHDASGSLFDGEWDTTIATPVGKMAVKLHIATVDGAIQGTATQGDEVSAFIDPDRQGNTLRWSQRVAKPMRLTLKFEVTVNGDQMAGIAKAGVLPASQLTGKRI